MLSPGTDAEELGEIRRRARLDLADVTTLIVAGAFTSFSRTPRSADDDGLFVLRRLLLFCFLLILLLLFEPFLLRFFLLLRGLGSNRGRRRLSLDASYRGRQSHRHNAGAQGSEYGSHSALLSGFRAHRVYHNRQPTHARARSRA